MGEINGDLTQGDPKNLPLWVMNTRRAAHGLAALVVSVRDKQLGKNSTGDTLPVVTVYPDGTTVVSGPRGPDFFPGSSPGGAVMKHDRDALLDALHSMVSDMDDSQLADFVRTLTLTRAVAELAGWESRQESIG